jgi:polyisoprenoid-binding protein YceI
MIMSQTKWLLDTTHSELGFKIKHLMITHVSGAFKNFSGEVLLDETDLSPVQVNLTAEVASISTNNEQRDEHLRASDFFETAKYPELKFNSTSVERTDADTFALHGNLTLKGITKPISLKAEFNGLTNDPWGGERVGFVVTGKINRSDWGVNFNAVLEKGGVVLSEEVRINSEVQLVKQAAVVAA